MSHLLHNPVQRWFMMRPGLDSSMVCSCVCYWLSVQSIATPGVRENTRHEIPLIFQYTSFHSHINKEEGVQGDVELEAQKVSGVNCDLKVK